MGRAALIAHAAARRRRSAMPQFLRAKIATARFYADCLLPQASGYAHAVTHGGDSVLALPAEAY